MQAGLAGGSTDCAAFILAMNKLYKLNMTKLEIEKLGATLGADVVPCLYNTAIKANGIGDKITKINTDFLYYILVIKPELSFSTKEMFKKIDSNNKNIKQDVKGTDNIIKALQTCNIELLSNNLYNTFEEVVRRTDTYIKKRING